MGWGEGCEQNSEEKPCRDAFSLLTSQKILCFPPASLQLEGCLLSEWLSNLQYLPQRQERRRESRGCTATSVCLSPAPLCTFSQTRGRQQQFWHCLEYMIYSLMSYVWFLEREILRPLKGCGGVRHGQWHGWNFSVQAREHSTTEKNAKPESKKGKLNCLVSLGRCAAARPWVHSRSQVHFGALEKIIALLQSRKSL